jgi:hypothetical protein
VKKLNFKAAPPLLLALFMLSGGFLYLASQASAATLTNTYIRTNRMGAGGTSTWRLVFKTVGAGATSVVVDFNGNDTTTWSGSSGNVLTGANTTSVASCPGETGASALPGSLTATGSSSRLMTITGVTALSATTSYCVDITSSTALTLPTAGEYHPTVTVGADSTTIALRTVSGANGDQISVSAIVPPTFNLALDGNTDYFGASAPASILSSSSIKVSNGRTVTINTNAKNGWFAWAADTGGLTSAAAGKTLSPPSGAGNSATLSAGTEGYVFGITSVNAGSSGATVTQAPAYTSNNTSTGGGLDSTFRSIASSNGTANGVILTVKELAAISATTPAANDYSDTITIIGAGYF